MARYKVDDKTVMDTYNTHGKSAALDLIGNTYGVKDTKYVLRRLKSTEKYCYDKISDKFGVVSKEPFIPLDELCSLEPTHHIAELPVAKNPVQQVEFSFETMVQQLVQDRFMEYSRYIQLDSSNRIWSINKSALTAAGYQLNFY